MKSIFNFCPNCTSKHFTFTDNRRFHCNKCEFVYYHNIASAVAVIFTFDDKILFTVRNINPKKGKWDLPGGFVDTNETAEEAACREIQEELGIKVLSSNLKYLTTFPNDYLYKNVLYKTLDVFFEYMLETDLININAFDEIKELVWVKKSELDLDKIGFKSVKNIIKYITE